MGGCAMVGQSIINVKSGGRGRLSGIVASVALLLFILYLSDTRFSVSRLSIKPTNAIVNA
jgi:MFS superfamily sulfate permease-like transporter